MSNTAKTPDEDSREAQVKALFQMVGARVLAARKGAGFSRRELSERSGVSTRYLAQLESGEGNISIGLLKQVSIALEKSIETLISADNPQSVEVARVSSLYLNADAKTRQRALQVLDPEGQSESKAHRICLTGLRGAGKSTLGALLAQDFGMPFVELSEQIEKIIGVPVGEIIALYGEDGYRQIEAETLDRIITENDKLILAVGGGIVSAAETFERVLTDFHTVWIKAQPVEHMNRVRAQGDLRPMAGNPQAMEQLRQILKAREVHYSLASYQLDTSGKSVQASRAELSQLLAPYKVAASAAA